jgi:hypothetical protein
MTTPTAAPIGKRAFGPRSFMDRAALLPSQSFDSGSLHEARRSVLTHAFARLDQVTMDARTAVGAAAEA